ncbi:PAS domain S-box protein [Halorientalis salina]|uniref:PAS domain S-box protein n=1 Tax=Halorientalis salina TaxID=2932266 RepID=UPI0010AC3594|nr:PAS domain-containing protein [Halorientalis salina]
MDVLQATYLVLFGGAALACLGSVVQTRRLPSRDMRRGLAGLLLLSGLWALAVVVQFLVPTLWLKEVAYTAGLVVGFGTVFAWLYFVSAYTGRQYHRDRRLVAAGAAVYGLATVVKVTNPIHGQYFTPAMNPVPFPHMAVSHSSIHWLTMGVAYALSAVGLWVLYDAFRERDTPLTLYVLVGMTALPALPYLLASLFPELLLQVNYEPLGVAVFAVGVLVFAEDTFMELSTPGHSQLVDILSEGVLLLDENGHVVSHNDQATEMYPGLREGTESLAALDTSLSTLSIGEKRVVTRTVDGTTRHVQATRSAIDAGPQFIASAITLSDVTRLVHLEHVTSAHSAVSKAIVEARTHRAVKERVVEELATVPAYRFVWVASGDGDTAHSKHVAGDVDDYLDSIALGPQGDDGTDPVVDAVVETDGSSNSVEVQSTDGETAWKRRARELDISACARMSLDPDGEGDDVLGVYTTDADGFSESERAMFVEIRETLQHAISAIRTREEAQRYQKAVNQAGYGLYILDAEGTIQYVNPAVEEITGHTPSETVGRPLTFLTGGDETSSDDVWDTVESGSVWEGEVSNKRKNGERYWARRTIAPVTDMDSELMAVVAIEVDITDKRVRQQRLTVLNRVLRHNLRNEMSVITGNADLVLHDDDGGAVREPVQRIRDAADDLIQLSEKAHRIERLIDADEHDGETITLGSTLDAVRLEVTEEFPDATVDTSSPDRAVSVDAALRPALAELAHNALEHNEGDPNLRLEGRVDDAGTAVTVTVADDGPGLPDHELRVLQSGDESALKHGSGLGLWLVNWLVVQCGGTLDIDADDSGTTITLSVPAVTDQATPSATPGPE